MTNYDTYTDLNTGVPVAFIILMMAIMLFLVIVHIVARTTSVQYYVLLCMYGAIKLVYGDAVELKKVDGATKLDCFPFPDDKEGDPLQTTPIANCSDYDYESFNNTGNNTGNNTIDDVTIICYTFVFNFPTALSTAGGLLAIVGAGAKKFQGFAEWAFNEPGALRKDWIINNAGKLLLVASIVSSIFWGAIFVCGVAIPVFAKAITATTQSAVLFFSYTLVLSLMTGIGLYGIYFMLVTEPEEEEEGNQTGGGRYEVNNK